MIPVLNIIHLPQDQFPVGPLRTESMSRELNFKSQAYEHKFTYGVWDGIIVKGLPHTGISKSHKQIIQHAKDNGLNLCFIAEDDFKLTSPGSWRYFIDNIPDDFDIYLAGVSAGSVEEGNTVGGNWSGLFLYVVHHRFYDMFLSVPEEFNIDRWLSGMGLEAIEKKLGRKPVYKICYPMAAITRDGVSYKSGGHVNHQKWFNGYEQYQAET